jgi:hypothetical protein
VTEYKEQTHESHDGEAHESTESHEEGHEAHGMTRSRKPHGIDLNRRYAECEDGFRAEGFVVTRLQFWIIV